MSALTFKAVIGGVHFNPKKGIVKIQLEVTSYISLDELTTVGLQDESIRVTLESEQTRIGALGPITIDEEAAKKLKEFAATGIDQGEEHEEAADKEE